MNKSVTMQELTSVIGKEAAEAAINAFAGRHFYFPKKRHMVQFDSQAEKEQHIRNLFLKAGNSPEEIAAMMELTAKYIKDIIRK